MKILRVTIWLIAGVIAVLTSLSSYVVAKEERSPAVAYSFGMPFSTVAGGNLAAASYATRQSQNSDSRVSKFERRLAKKAYEDAPLSTSALSILIASKSSPSVARQRQALLDLGGKLTRRSGYIAFEQAKAASLRDDTKSFFLWLSRSMLVNTDLRSTYIRAMADTTSRKGSVEALLPVLGSDPNWAKKYWQAVVQRRESLVNAAELRIALSRSPWRQTTVTPEDKTLSIGLARNGEFDAALNLAMALTPSTTGTTMNSNVLLNGDFSEPLLLPPFDWQLTTTGNLGSSINLGDKSLLISAIGGARGSAARQLIRLSSGNYSLRSSIRSNNPIQANALTARIACAEPNAKSSLILPAALTAENAAQIVTIPDSSCKWYWFSVFVALADDSSGFDANVRQLSFVPEMVKQNEEQ